MSALPLPSPSSSSSACTAVSLILFVLLGQWLDRRLGTAPVFLLVCVFVGAGGAFYSMYRALMAAQRREDEARALERRNREGGERP